MLNPEEMFTKAQHVAEKLLEFKYDTGMFAGLSGLGYVPMVGSQEYSNESLGYIKGGEFLGQLINY
jgi:hypothetical protein